jgi:pimeloyl-ACP methyl ester carboxylesterase
VLASEVPIRETTLHVQEDGRGRAILFIHGMCGFAEVWNGQFDRLSDEFRCVSYDRRGHTRSGLGDGVERSVQLHADDAADLIRALDLAPVLLVGSSGGARIGVDMLVRHGDLIGSAVLSEPAILGLSDEMAGFVSDLKPALEAADPPDRAVDAFFEYVDPEVWATLSAERKVTYRENLPELFGDLRMPSYVPTAEEFASIDTPTRVLTGERSRPIFRTVATKIAAGIPGAELVELAGATHATYVLQPDAFAEAVRTFAR